MAHHVCHPTPPQTTGPSPPDRSLCRALRACGTMNRLLRATLVTLTELPSSAARSVSSSQRSHYVAKCFQISGTGTAAVLL